MMIREYNEALEEQVIHFILNIQRNELRVPITAEDQPDLRKVKDFYQVGNGNFWTAIVDDNVIGTIAVIDIGDQEVALRKMFVHPDWRGSANGVAQKLMDEVFKWCKLKKVINIYLGTIDIMKAAHRFYERNGFFRVAKDQLPGNFPVMKVDNVFYKFSFSKVS